MKKIIVYGMDEWTKELLTLSLCEKVAYFVIDEEDPPERDDCWNMYAGGYSIQRLLEEEKDDVIIIISNNRRYEKAARNLKEMGFIENVHFFNGWKLDENFYNVIDANEDWKLIEKNGDSNIFQNSVWEKRAEMMSGMIPDDVCSIMDLGCGDGKLKKYLSDKIKYIGVDYCYRDENTIVCDMNKEELPDISVDMYYLAGIVMYIDDIKHLFHQMKRAKYILLSTISIENHLTLNGRIFREESGVYSFRNTIIDDMVNQLYSEGFVLINCKYIYKVLNMHILLFQNIKTLVSDDLQD